MSTDYTTDKEAQFVKDLDFVLEQTRNLLIEKNRKYGDSALNPINIFSKLDAKQQLFVSIDHKMKRLKNQQVDDTEDTLDDLIGYCVLSKIFDYRKSGYYDA